MKTLIEELATLFDFEWPEDDLPPVQKPLVIARHIQKHPCENPRVTVVHVCEPKP